MSEDKDKELDENEEVNASHDHPQNEAEDDAGSDAFDALAIGDAGTPPSGTDSFEDSGDSIVTPPPSAEASQNQDSTQEEQGEAPSDALSVDESASTNFADSFEDNYESEFADYDDFYDDGALNEDDEFSDFDGGDDSFDDRDFDNAIDAEFSEFDDSDDFDGGDDDWSTEGSDEGDQKPSKKGKKASVGSSSALANLSLSSPLVKYGGIAAGVLVLGGAAMMFMGGGETPQANFRAPSSKQVSNSIPEPAQLTDTNTPRQQNGNAKPSGQSLSSIINSGKLNEDGEKTGMLDNLDTIDTKVQPTVTPQQQIKTVPEFKERQSLSALSSALPSPTPIGNTQNNEDISAQRAARPADTAMDVASEPVETVRGEALGQPTRQPQIIPSPFSDQATDSSQQPVGNQLESIKKQAENAVEQTTTIDAKETQSDIDKAIAEKKRQRQESLEQRLAESNDFMNSMSKERTDNPESSMPRPMDNMNRLSENVTKFEQQTSTFINRMQAVEEKLDQYPDPAIVKSLEDKIDFLTTKIGRLENNMRMSEKKTSKPSSQPSTASKKVAKASPVKKKAPPKISWELRAASPGQAWVSQKGQKELKQIGIGDKLAGVGTIQSISNSNGKWVVTGSSGTITQ